MTDGAHPTVFVSGMTADTFSTLQREVARGRLFSERFSPEQALVLDPVSKRVFRVTATPSEIPVGEIYEFMLDSLRFPRNAFCVPGGPAFSAQGLVQVHAGPATPARLAARVTGLGPVPAGTVLTVWLLHDLVVPTNLDPRDLALMPRLAVGANQPGEVFTIDGQLSTVGRADVSVWNTVAVAIRAGTLTVAADSTAVLEVPLTDELNMAVDPRVVLGPQFVPSPAAAMPSGVAAAILTDVFMRPATIFPELSAVNAFPQRLLTITQSAILRFGGSSTGVLTAANVQSVNGAFLAPANLNRVAITLEPVARQTHILIPSEQAVVLVGLPSPSTPAAVAT